jgi:hypothetical protein
MVTCQETLLSLGFVMARWSQHSMACPIPQGNDPDKRDKPVTLTLAMIFTTHWQYWG